VVEDVVDLSLPGAVFGWQQRRSYDSLMNTGTTDELPGINGQRWTSDPDSMFIQAGKNGNINIDLSLSASNKVVFTWNAQTGTYTSPPDMNATLTVQNPGTSSETYMLTVIQTGDIYIFYGLSSQVAPYNSGWLKERTNRYYSNQSLNGTRYYYNSNTGEIDHIIPADPQGAQGYLIQYTHYTTGPLLGLLKSIQVELNNTTIAEADYTYCDGSQQYANCGLLNDLIQVRVMQLTTMMPAGGTGTGFLTRYTQYRYCTNSGNAHQLAMVFDPDAVQRACAANNASPDSLLSMANSAVQGYASRSFTYYTDNNTNTDSNVTTPWGQENLSSEYVGGTGTDVQEYNATIGAGMVQTETINGACASCGGGAGGIGITHTYYYMILNGGPSSSGDPSTIDPNLIVSLVVEDTQDSSGTPVRRTIYGLNSWGNELRRIVIANPTQGTLTTACTSSRLVNPATPLALRIQQRRSPSAHDGCVTSNSAVTQFLNPCTSSIGSWSNDTATLNSSSGQILGYEYDGNNFPMSVLVQVGGGTGSTAYYVSATDNDPDGKPTATCTYLAPTTVRGTLSTASGTVTGYSYTYWDGQNGHNVQTMTKTLPIIGNGSGTTTNQNGSGTATATQEYYDNVGRLRWTQDGEGAINYYSYNPNLGGLAYTVTDIDPQNPPSDMSSTGSGMWVAWTGNPPFTRGISTTAASLTTKQGYDNLGRLSMTIPPDLSVHYMAYGGDSLFLASGTGPVCFGNTVVYRFPYCNGSGYPQMPIQVSETDGGGRPTASYTVNPAKASLNSSGVPVALQSGTTQSDYVSLTNYSYDQTTGQLLSANRYFDVSGNVSGTNYYPTGFIYDLQGRKVATAQYVSGSATQVHVQAYDYLGRVTDGYKGVYPSGMPAASNIYTCSSGVYSYASFLQHVSHTAYDPDNNVTQRSGYYAAGSYTGANYHRNFRGYVRGVEPFYGSDAGGTNTTSFGPYQVTDVDWQGRTIDTAIYSSSSDNSPPDWYSIVNDDTGLGDGSYAASNQSSNSTVRCSLSKTLYDVLSRVYETQQYSVDSSGAAGSYLKTDYYYDRNDRQVASVPAYAAATETAYDGAGRQYETRLVMGLSSSSPYNSSGAFQYCSPTPDPLLSNMGGSASGSSGVMIQMSHTVFDGGGRPTEQYSFEVNHDSASTGTGISLSANNYVRTTVFNWYDGAGRLLQSGNYGCDNGGSDTTPGTWTYVAVPTRNSTPPYSTSTATFLFTQYTYNSISGLPETVVAPIGAVGGTVTQTTKTFYDNLGRTTYVAENWTAFSPLSPGTTGGGTYNDQNKVTQFVYNGLGQKTQLTALDQAGTGSGPNENTYYAYADPVDASLVTTTTYPDGGTVVVTYNLDGSPATQTDQRGTVLTFAYTVERRPQMQEVTTVGSNTDTSILSIRRDYDAMGRVQTISSCSDAGGSTTVNQVQYAFDGLGRKTAIYQSHSGTVTIGSTPSTQFTYDPAYDGNNVLSNGGRLQMLTYPNGRQLAFGYNGSGTASVDSALSRVQAIGGTESTPVSYVTYSYNGAGRPVQSQLLNGTMLDLVIGTASGTTSGIYAGLDRFGRTFDQRWRVAGSTSVSVADIQYGYDLAGNRIYHQDTVAGTASLLDESYAYDGQNRLYNRSRGQLVSGTVSTPTAAEGWTLDALGNFTGYSQSSGAGTLTQSGNIFSLSNELTTFNTQGTTSWASPGYDAAGNMNVMPQPNSPANPYTATYDAWNRLVTVSAGTGTSATLVAQYKYDGLNQRIIKATYTGGTLSETRDFYYNDQWQVLEERLETGGTLSSSANRQNVWGAQYVDELILRDRDSDNNPLTGTLGFSSGTTSGLDERLFAMQDGNWNVVAVAGTDSTVQERYTYSAYGIPEFRDANFVALSSGSSSYLWDTLYTGRQYDTEAGLQYSRNRCYHPVLGRFLSRDPIGYDGGDNLYEYTGDHPTIATDAAGLYPCDAAQTKACDAQCEAYCGKGNGAVAKAVCDAWEKEITVGGVVCEVLGFYCDCTCKPKNKKDKWRCTTKPRGSCPAQCQIPYVGFGRTKEAAKDASEGSCQAAGCHTPGGKPYNCNCGHTTCTKLP
jgi:RHS repeat-associated protein